MKKIFTFLILFSFITLSLSAQTRYVDEVFDNVNVTSDVTYGVNATLLALPIVGEAIPEELKMDIYMPDGDTRTDRPVVLVFHTGNFLPSVTNGQIAGTKTDNSAVEICTQLAKRGFVAASVTYRLGWNPLAQTQPERALGLIQAAYRGLQDGRNAIRFMRNSVMNSDNPYGIDMSRMAVWGNGTGGYLVLGMATLNDYTEIISTTNGPGKFLLDLNADGTPETPMVVPTYHGDIEGKVLTIAPDGAFGVPGGDTTNYVNLPEISSEFNLCVNVGGALGDISWLDEATPPIISVQSANDIFAPYNDAVLIVPTTGDPIVQVQGGQAIGAKQSALGTNDMWEDAIFNDEITMEAVANSATAGHPYYEGLFPYITEPNSSGLDEGVVINWWDPGALSPPILPDFPNGVPWNMLTHPSGGTFHDQGLALNEGMSAEKSRANIAKVMGYVIPRACVALNLEECAPLYTNTEDVIRDDAFVSISPNPVQDQMVIRSTESMIQAVAIYNMSGQLVYNKTDINAPQFRVDRQNMASGMYLVKASFEEGIVTKQVIIE